MPTSPLTAALLQSQNADPTAALMITPQMQLAQSLLQQGTDTSPIRSPWQGLARLAQVMAGNKIQNRALQGMSGAYSGMEKAQEMAADPTMGQGQVSGSPVTEQGGQITTQNPQAGQSAGAANPGMKYANLSLPADMVDTSGVQQTAPAQRANLAAAMLAQRYPALAAQMRPQLLQTAQAASPPTTYQKLATPSGAEIGVGINAQTGQPTGQVLNPSASMGGNLGAKPTTVTDNAIALGLKPGTPEFNRYVGQITTEGVPEKIIPATAAQKQQYGLQTNMPATFNTKTGEVKPQPVNPGDQGPIYDSFTGQPLGTANYQDATTQAKIKSGELLPHEPKPLEPSSAQELAAKGTQLQGLKQQLAAWKPDYGRILGSGSSLRGFIGGPAYNEAADWINRTNGLLLSTVKDTVGRSPILIDEFNKNRPEGTDAPDVILNKTRNLIRLQQQETGNLANTYLKGGYLGQQVVQAAGFDPRSTAVGSAGDGAAQAAVPSPASIAHLRANPALAPQFDAAYGAGTSKQFMGAP